MTMSCAQGLGGEAADAGCHAQGELLQIQIPDKYKYNMKTIAIPIKQVQVQSSRKFVQLYKCDKYKLIQQK